MRPAALVCHPCNLRVEADFIANEFASLSEDDLHFLRIFVHTEGRIREMESALAVSYPTVKAKLADLKHKLQMDTKQIETSAGATDQTAQTLRQLESGDITYDQALARLREKGTAS